MALRKQKAASDPKETNKLIQQLATKRSMLTGSELRLLRTSLGLTQLDLGITLDKRELTVARWEKGQTVLGNCEELVIRIFALQQIGAPTPPIEQMMDWMI